MRRVVTVFLVAVFLVLSASSVDAFHFRKYHHRHHHHHYHRYRPSYFSFGFSFSPRRVHYHRSYYPTRVYYPRVYYPRVYYPRVVSYVSPYFCSTPSYSTGYYGYTGTTYYNPSSNYVNYQLPAVSYPAELSYGPQAVKQFMGVDRNFALGPLLNQPDRDALVRPVVTDIKIRATNAETLKKARGYLAIGDDLFRRQKFHSALQQYKTATRFAPELAEGYFRQGHALVATSRFDLATEAFKRGLKTDANVAKSDFLLSEIYGDAKMAKTAHLENLATAALDRDSDADLMFLLGVFLHFDGQADRGVKFFQRANDLAGANNAHLAHFLPRSELKRATPETPEIRLVGLERTP